MADCKKMTAYELAQRLGSSDEPFLLDVREPDEVAEWSIREGYNIPLGQLPQRLGEVPRDREIATLCAVGARAITAAEFLSNNGFEATVIEGGMGAWGQVYDTAEIGQDELSIVQVRRRGKGCLSYLVGGEGKAFVIDPSLDIEVYIDIAKQRNWQIEKIFDTHLHADHISGTRELTNYTSARLYLNPADTFSFDFEPLRDGEEFELAGGHHFKVDTWYTPGHTNGSTVFEIPNLTLISGDTLFADGVGRPDLADKVREFASNLYDSLHKLTTTLADEVLVLPAHYSNSVRVIPGQVVGDTIGNLKTRLEPLSMSKEDFIDWAEDKITPRPPNYADIIRVNMGRYDGALSEIRYLESGPNRCSA